MGKDTIAHWLCRLDDGEEVLTTYRSIQDHSAKHSVANVQTTVPFPVPSSREAVDFSLLILHYARCVSGEVFATAGSALGAIGLASNSGWPKDGGQVALADRHGGGFDEGGSAEVG